MRRRFICYLYRGRTLSLALVFLLLNVSCGNSQHCNPEAVPPPRSAFTIQESPAVQIATEVARDVGKVLASGRGSTEQTIFIFEEKHDSRIAQMEIAVMLWRLQKIHHLRQISVEGAIFAKDDLPVGWFHHAAEVGEAKQAGREAVLSLLRQGEIAAGEFIALAQPSVQVKGVELQSEYEVKASKTNSALGFLVGIAEKSLSSSDVQRVNDLVKAEKIEEALDHIFSRDSWSRERYQKLFGNDIASTEEAVVIMREIEAKARELDVRIESRQAAGFQEDLNFQQVASRRSCTMVRNTLTLLDARNQAPVALVIGAAHTAKVVELIKAARVSYVVLSPLSLVTPTKAARLTTPMYERKIAFRSVDGARMLGGLLDGRRKPGPLLGKIWFQSKAAIFIATERIVNAAARHERVPSDSLRTELQALAQIKVDWSSLKVTEIGDQVRVICKVTAQTSDSDPRQTVDIWITGWHQPPPQGPFAKTPLSDDDSDIEKFILAALEEDRNEKVLNPKDDPGPKPGEVATVQLSTQTRAAFSTDPTLLQQVTSAK